MASRAVIAKGFELPPFFFPGWVRVVAYSSDMMEQSEDSPANQFPLTFKAKGLKDFTFPIDPMINISKKNVIVRRTVAKGKKKGTIKERWTEDDSTVTISGLFINQDGDYPTDLVSRLNEFGKLPKAIDVECSLLNDQDIHQIVIESINYPFTKGPENQAFEITAYSDDVTQLLIEG